MGIIWSYVAVGLIGYAIGAILTTFGMYMSVQMEKEINKRKD